MKNKKTALEIVNDRSPVFHSYFSPGGPEAFRSFLKKIFVDARCRITHNKKCLSAHGGRDD